MQDCGGCIYFQKLGGQFGGGLCGALDARTTSDSGRKCKKYKGMKYDRTSVKGKRHLEFPGNTRLVNTKNIS